MANRGTITSCYDRESLIELLKQYNSPKHCAEGLGVSPQSVYELIMRWNIDTKLIYDETLMDKLNDPDTCNEIEVLVGNGMSLADVSRRYGATPGYIASIVQRGIQNNIYHALVRGIQKNTERKKDQDTVLATDISRLMDKGLSISDVSKQLHISYSVINRIIKLFKLKTPTMRRVDKKPSKEQLQQAIQNNEKGIGVLAKGFGVNVYTLKQWCNDYGLVIPPSHGVPDILKRDKDYFAKQMASFRTQSDMAIAFGCSTCAINELAIKHGLRRLLVTDRCPTLGDKEALLDMYKTLSIQDIADALGCSHPVVRDKLIEYGADTTRQSTSKIEQRFYAAILAICPDAILQDRVVIGPKELDIYIPSKKIGIEINGLFWHSSKFKDKNYHLEKKQLASEVGIRIIHIFEDELENKWDVVLRKITRLLSPAHRIFARKCIATERVDEQLFNDFHIQGYRRHTYCVSLEFEGRVVASGLFLKNKQDVELIRYASSECVVGGMSRVIKTFERQYGNLYNTLYTYADLTWCDYYNSYDKIGMNKEHTTPPDYYYYKTYDSGVGRFGRQNRRNFTKDKIRVRFPDSYDDSLTEWQMMNNLGYVRIYDCGKIKYSIQLNGSNR